MCKNQCPSCKCKGQEFKIEVSFVEGVTKEEVETFTDEFLEFLSGRNLCYGGSVEPTDFNGYITFSDKNEKGGVTKEDRDEINEWFGDVVNRLKWDYMSITKVKE